MICILIIQSSPFYWMKGTWDVMFDVLLLEWLFYHEEAVMSGFKV